MIVRTHEYAYEQCNADGKIHRLHWQKGMFLCNRGRDCSERHNRTKGHADTRGHDSDRGHDSGRGRVHTKGHGEAMLELREREFHLYAEAVWPQFFMNVLKQTLHKLITDNWPGLKDRYYFAVPCQTTRPNGKPCHARFDIDALQQFLEQGYDKIPCQVCRQPQKIVDLLYGFEQENPREQLDRIEAKIDHGFAQVMEEFKEEFEGLESRIANYVMMIMQAIASESKDGPRIFTIVPVER
ncbi:MAG: hypothetical protein AB1847_12420 [bacterium]